MSYVELKHLLADLALEATRHPERATWAPVLAAYGTLATPQRLAVPWSEVQQVANELGGRFRWTATPATLARLLESTLLEHSQGTVTVRSAFAPHLAYLRRHGTRLLETLARLQSLPAPGAVPLDLSRGAALFNAGLFFECHEYLEGPWRATGGPEKNLYHGLVQVAAAFYHFEKGNLHGARTLLTKGVRRLESYPGAYLGIDLKALRSVLKPWMQLFEAELIAEGETHPAYPQIEFKL